MLTHNLGYPRIGTNRDLKKIVESYWKGDIDKSKLVESTEVLRVMHWTKQKEAGIDRVPSNDFSLYDQVLDTALLVGAIPGLKRQNRLPWPSAMKSKTWRKPAYRLSRLTNPPSGRGCRCGGTTGTAIWSGR
ncbi:Cobalamin-independent synthase, N-terminal domain [Fodinibius roseus]|uniref:Cobalamin-independent synthase, N-terminal domain n=1 Tax=Fodinibius roseus TaxID=1194090 RepID=A0A1M5F481_9BACT|nr:Cobalamin-independent synthase, N-terminal domain [Fodinibius roseus]